MTLPTEDAARKDIPIYSGVLMYFPDALAAVAELSRIGNEQHNPGEPLHWARGKSMNQLDTLTRHLMEAGTIDTDGVRHSAKVAWRALANLQLELEAAEEAEDEPTKKFPTWKVITDPGELPLNALIAAPELHDIRPRTLYRVTQVDNVGQRIYTTRLLTGSELNWSFSSVLSLGFEVLR